MSTIKEKCVQYFSAPYLYFWQWADDGTVLEFGNGRTVCYRDDLTFMLANIGIKHTPPVGAIVLLLCACRERYDDLYNLDSYLYKLGYDKDYNEHQHIEAKGLIGSAIAFLKVVNGLPVVERSGMRRVALLQAVFDAEEPADFNIELQVLLNAFKTGQHDEQIFGQHPPYRFDDLRRDLEPLVEALARYKDSETLLNYLKTGLAEAPEKAEIEVPEPESIDLLTELSYDSRTEGMYRLAKRIMAALNIPMHFSGSSDDQFGGVSDITNRGNYDKLLLSELAQDDILLMARLANNEALFLKREQLPVKNPTEWHLLMDTTLKTWGTPRVFELSAALAFGEGKAMEAMHGWALGGQEFKEMDLRSKNGVLNALSHINTGMHCGVALQKIFASLPGSNNRFMLIKMVGEREEAAFLMALDSVRDRLDYLVEVDREGNIALYQTRGKRHRLLAKANIDLNELTIRPGSVGAPLQRRLAGNAEIPAIMRLERFPLFYPNSKTNTKNFAVLKTKEGAVLVVTLDQRLLFWVDKSHGAIELIDNLEIAGVNCWGEGIDDSDGSMFLLIYNKSEKRVGVFWIDMVNGLHQKHFITNESVNPTFSYGKNKFYARSGIGAVRIDPKTGLVETLDMRKEAVPWQRHKSTNHKYARELMNMGYSVINSAKTVGVRNLSRLILGPYELRLNTEGKLCWMHINYEKLPVKEIQKTDRFFLQQISNIKFTKYRWTDGSELILDSRGLLHLKSSDKNIPEITIITITNVPVACWSADGKVSGSRYFINDDGGTVMPDKYFYDTYIAKFIRRLL